ncbi:hypothetical protein BH09BAC6_BH09BAC6_12240 [soil metagenome]|jgi:sphingomyelin phosphodiesterase acid-like 3
MKKVIFIFLFLAGGLMQQLFAQAKPLTPGNIISVSDIHFDPFYDPSLMSKLITSDYKLWPGIFGSSTITQFSPYKSDSNFPLFKSALAAMQQQNPGPGFIVITGDFLCHDFTGQYGQYGSAYPDSMKSFTAKTIKFMAMLFDQYFPKTVVLPVLGNNDSYCGDYMIEPAGPFLNMFAKAWVPLQRNNSPAADINFVNAFSKGGYYTFPIPGSPGGMLVLLNTVFFSKKYVNYCGSMPGNPAGDELTWLGGIFKQNKVIKSKLWLVCHIPPGIDAYLSSQPGQGSCAQNIHAMWKDSSNKVFLDLVTKNAAFIHAGFAGHTHMDDFRVFYNKAGTPVSFLHITPAISPYFGNNPGFQLVSYNKTSFNLLNSQTYYLNLNNSNPAWAFEYNFNTTYGISGINPLTLDQVRKKLSSGTVYLNKYIGYYDVSNPSLNGINSGNWKAFWCTTGNLSKASFAGCYCGANGQ